MPKGVSRRLAEKVSQRQSRTQLAEMVWDRLNGTDFQRAPYVTLGMLPLSFPDVAPRRLEAALAELVRQGRLDWDYDRAWGKRYFPAGVLVQRLCAQQDEGGRLNWRSLVNKHELSPAEKRRLPLVGELWPHMTREAKLAVLVVTGLPRSNTRKGAKSG